MSLCNKEESFDPVIDSRGEGFIFLDENWKITGINSEVWSEFGFLRDRESQNSDFLSIFPEFAETIVSEKAADAMSTGKTYMIKWSGFDLYLCKIGEGLGIRLKRIYENHRKDISRHNTKENFSAASLQKSREEERKAIAREIHDELGQDLTALKFQLHTMYRKMSKDQMPLREECRHLLDRSDALIKTVKNIASTLRLEFLESHALSDAIKLKVHKFSKESGLSATVTIDPYLMNISENHEICLYRVLQESLTNIARHSEASRVEVSLNRKACNAVLSIRDNGQGISQDEIQADDSYGIIGMQERCRILGGKLEINGSPGKGTKVTASLPLSEASYALKN